MMSLGFSMDSLPFVAMAVVEIGEVGMITLAKAAMSGGMSNFVYVVYYNAIGTFFLSHYIIYRCYRAKGPQLTFSLLCKFFLLGLIGICFVQLPAFTGIKYSSPTLAATMANLIPGITFTLAVVFGMEKIALKSRSSQAKILGTIVSISGAFIVTLYKGPPIVGYSSASHTYFHLPAAKYSNWALGGLFLTVTCVSSAIWKIFQAVVLKEYHDKMTVVFFTCLFGTFQCAIVSLISERDPNAWKVKSSTEMTAIIYAAIVGTVYRTSVIAWCLTKKGPVFVALFKPLGTAIAVFMAIMLLGETPHLGSLIGAMVIGVGFYAVVWGQSKEKLTTSIGSSLEAPAEKIS